MRFVVKLSEVLKFVQPEAFRYFTCSLSFPQNSGHNRSTDVNILRHEYFGKNFGVSLMKLLVLLTTANNPDGIAF